MSRSELVVSSNGRLKYKRDGRIWNGHPWGQGVWRAKVDTIFGLPRHQFDGLTLFILAFEVLHSIWTGKHVQWTKVNCTWPIEKRINYQTSYNAQIIAQDATNHIYAKKI